MVHFTSRMISMQTQWDFEMVLPLPKWDGVRDKGQTLNISKGPHSGMLWLSKHF